MKPLITILLILVSVLNQAIVPAAHPLTPATVSHSSVPAVPHLSGAYPPPGEPLPQATPVPTLAAPAPRPAPVPQPASAPLAAKQSSRLRLKTNLTCVTPGQDLGLDWDFQPAPEWANRESELELVLSLPEDLTLVGETTGSNPASRQVRPAFAKTGKLQGKLAAKAADDLLVTAKVMNGEKVVAETALKLGPGERFDVAAGGGEIASAKQQVKVNFPQGALKEDVSVCIRAAANDHPSPLGGPSFVIEAQGKTGGAAVKQFAHDLEISYVYDPDQIGVDQASLSLVYYDETVERWKYLDSQVDTAQHVIRGRSNHLTEFSYDLNSVDKYRIQDFSAFQISEYSGSANYSYPLTVPPGPGGLAPELILTYSSGIADSGGPRSQASWVGLGWELNPGAVTRNTNGTVHVEDDTFSLQIGKLSGTLLPVRTGVDATNGKSYVEYESQEANFARVRRYGGYTNGGECTYTCDTSFWQVWDTGGTVYTFNERQNYYPYFGSGAPTGEVMRWALTQVKNTSNQTIEYSYTTHWTWRDGNGGGYQSIDDLQLFLHEIRYANDHYLIHFEDENRSDVDDECVLNDLARCTVDMKRLHSITMWYNPDGDAAMAGLEQIRRYAFSYAEGGTEGVFPNVVWKHENNDPDGHTPTLTSLQEFGIDNDYALPALSFSYSDRMHLTDAANGYNGKVHFAYEAVPWPTGAPLWGNGTTEGTPLKFWRKEYVRTSTRDPYQNELVSATMMQPGSSLPGGRNLWMQMSIANPPANGYVILKIGGPNGTMIADSSYIPTSSGAGNYSFIVNLPLNLVENANYQFIYYCKAPCYIDDIQYGSIAARYRATEKWIYPNAELDDHEVYRYEYSGPAMNDAAHSSVTPASDFTREKVITPPYTELRGHAQVKAIRPDGSYTLSNYHQSDRLAGRMSSMILYNSANHKLSEIIYTYATPVELLPTDAAAAYLPKYTVNNVLYPKLDARLWWTPQVTVEKRTYAGDGSPAYLATKTDTSYVLDASGKPVYGKVRAVTESEWSGSAWTVKRKQFSTYTATDVNTDARYFVGHPSSTALCSPAGSEANPEYRICGTNASDYYGFTSYTYNSYGQVSETINLLNFTGAPSTSYANRYSAYTQTGYDDYGNVKTVGTGYKDQNAAGVVQSTTTFCYQAETSGQNPACDNYLGTGVNGIYLAWVKNPLNQVTHYQNDPRLSQPLKQIDPNGAETTVTYDEFGRIASVRKPGDVGTGVRATLAFSYHPPESGVSPYFWTEATQKLNESDTLSQRKFYNGVGELIQTQQVGVKVTDATCGGDLCTVVVNQKLEYVNGVKTSTQAAPYAAANQAGYISPSDPWADITVTTFDEQSRPLAVIAPAQALANSQRFSYTLDSTGLRTTATDSRGNTTYSWKNAWDQTVKIQPPSGPSLVYEYDLAGRLSVVRQVNPGGSILATTTINYDAGGRKIGLADPDMGAWSYAYNAQGSLVAQVDAKGQRICLYYDNLNRLAGKHYPAAGQTACPASAPATLDVSYTYDTGSFGKGRRTGMVDASGTTAWSYDARGRMTGETRTVKDGTTLLGVYTTSWTYTSADRIASLTYPSGEVVSYAYLPQGTVDQIVSAQISYLSGAGMDAAGRLTSLDFGNGTRTAYAYYPWNDLNGRGGRLQKLQSGNLDGLAANLPSLQSLEYNYDRSGNITSLVQQVGRGEAETLTYQYDNLNRLTGGSYSDSPAYDANTGNLISKGGKTLGYAAQDATFCAAEGPLTKLHAATTFGTDRYCYDANGNMTRRQVGTNTYTLSYDRENRLSAISAGPTYVYDGDGQRVLVKQPNGDKTIYIGEHFEVFLKAGYTAPPAVNPNCRAAGRRCGYVPLVLTLAGPSAPLGQVWKSYYQAGGKPVALRVQDRAGGNSGIYWLYSDHLNSTSVTASLDVDADPATLRYTAWGETRAASGVTPTSVRYTGQREAEAGLYFYKARWYDPALGRFAQADTIVPDPDKVVGWDRYAYVNNNPVKYTDPSGHEGGTYCDRGYCREKRDLTGWLVAACVDAAKSSEMKTIARMNATIKSVSNMPYNKNPDENLQLTAALAMAKKEVYSYFVSFISDGKKYDVKTKIKESLHETIKLGDNWYEYSTTGNILYGFYGLAAGFSKLELRLGAGAAQMSDFFKKGVIPGGFSTYYDTSDDYYAVTFGFFLYENYYQDGELTISEFREALSKYQFANKLAIRQDPRNVWITVEPEYADKYYN